MREEEREYFKALSKRDLHQWIKNVDGTIDEFYIGERSIPLFSPTSKSSAYVTNPGVHYFDYVAHELEVTAVNGGYWRAKMLRILRHLLGFNNLSKIVYANNFLLSTNPAPNLSEGDISKLQDYIKTKFPRHALLIRSVGTPPITSLSSWNALKKAGFRFLFNRRVFYLDYREGVLKPKRSLRNDINSLSKGSLELIEDAPPEMVDFDAIAEMYCDLYIKKHYSKNLDLTASWFKMAASAGFIKTNLFMLNGETIAFAFYTQEGDKMIGAYLGYRDSLNREHKLYRRVIACTIRQAMNRRCLIHLSSGATDYKMRRGAIEAVEYEAIDISRCNIYDRIRWKALFSLSSKYIEPFSGKVVY